MVLCRVTKVCWRLAAACVVVGTLLPLSSAQDSTAAPQTVAEATVAEATVAEATVVEPVAPAIPAAPVRSWEDNHVMGVLPSYQTVWNPWQKFEPLSAKQKWSLFARSTVDPFVLTTAGIGSVLSQVRNGNPNYGKGFGAFGQRLGASYADFTGQNLFTTALLPTVLHQDPRYWRRGERSGTGGRILYALSRVAITRNDSGNYAPNVSYLLGTAMGVTMSSVYYPQHHQSGALIAQRIGVNYLGTSLGNLLPEFWPDIAKLLKRHHVPMFRDKHDRDQ